MVKDRKIRGRTEERKIKMQNLKKHLQLSKL